MSQKFETRRQNFIDFILKRDTVLMEFGLGVSGLINAAQVLTIDAGRPMAPFLFSALAWLKWGGALWVSLLLLYGVCALVALTVGLQSGNTFFYRGAVTLCGSLLWLVVAVAVLTSGMHWLIGFRYGFTAFLAFCVAVILVVKHDFKEDILHDYDAESFHAKSFPSKSVQSEAN